MSGSPTFTERELDVMAVLWELGSATVPEVRKRIADPLAYTTVQTVLRILEEKGHVGHVEDGRFHRYHPLVGREEAGRGALARVLTKIFAGSPEHLLTQFLSERDLTGDEVRRIRGILDSHGASAAREARKGGEHGAGEGGEGEGEVEGEGEGEGEGEAR